MFRVSYLYNGAYLHTAEIPTSAFDNDHTDGISSPRTDGPDQHHQLPVTFR